jgi:signal peptidase I
MTLKKLNLFTLESSLVIVIFVLPAWIGLWDSPSFFMCSFAVYAFSSVGLSIAYFLTARRWGVITIFLKMILISTLVVLGLIVCGKFLFGYKIFYIPTHSMVPTLLVGDIVIVNTHVENYNKSDVIVFSRSENQRDVYYVKRISHVKGDIFHETELDDQHYAVMGDNRDESYDSRIYGAISKEDVVGKAMWILTSYNNEWRTDRSFLVIE